eukprot:357698-Chlamydomonas_euryale.AAC.2
MIETKIVAAIVVRFGSGRSRIDPWPWGTLEKTRQGGAAGVRCVRVWRPPIHQRCEPPLSLPRTLRRLDGISMLGPSAPTAAANRGAVSAPGNQKHIEVTAGGPAGVHRQVRAGGSSLWAIK